MILRLLFREKHFFRQLRACVILLEDWKKRRETEIMKKKVMALLMALALTASLCACSKGKTKETETKKPK